MAVETDADEGSAERSLAPRRVAEMLATGELQVIDVREDEKWEAGRVAGARHVPILELTSEPETVAREKPVVFYCRSGNRSAMVAEAFRVEGYEAYNMSGGISAWAQTGLGLEPRGGCIA